MKIKHFLLLILLTSNAFSQNVSSYALGNAYYKLKAYDRAMFWYEKAIEINPKHENAYLNMGNACYRQQEYINAIASYEKAIEINSKHENAYYNLGIVYSKHKRYSEAIRAYKKAIKINPKKYRAYVQIGTIYWNEKKYEVSIEWYKKAIEINSKEDLAYLNLFEVWLTQNESFEKVLEKAYMEQFKGNKKSLIHYDMLKVLQNIVEGRLPNLELWRETYNGVGLAWNFDDLDMWLETMEDSEVKGELNEAVWFFKGYEK
ncbi:MAG: Unknown protein [uncultured Sulfurovum sp.]|uniref:Uncharacterized protein n=1 Tax=uncultured Sulfurovum sp. TaxID=269237 RepID=A0A6S6SHF3_9BACT|nr:MAG: Unknown protein [uncultured Sulfurovum sp.]